MNEVLRQEKKFLISLDQLYIYSSNLGQIMTEDLHNNGEGYCVRSLYFDSIDDMDFQDKEDGVELRRKIRLRNYGPDSTFAILEMKQKQGMLQKKRSLKMERVDAAELINGNYTVLLQYDEAFAKECYSFMKSRCYLPKTVIEYKRKAFIAKENSIRVTFDHNITGTESCFNIFEKNLLLNPILNPYLAVLEVKFNGFLLSYIKDMLMECDKTELSVSKYCLGRAVSKHFVF